MNDTASEAEQSHAADASKCRAADANVSRNGGVVIISRSSLSPLDFDGPRVFDCSAGQDWGASFAVIEMEPEKRHREARSIRSDKYYLVTRGEVTFKLNGQAHRLSSGDFCFVCRGQRFAYENRSSERATLVLVHTPPFDVNNEEFISCSVVEKHARAFPTDSLGRHRCVPQYFGSTIQAQTLPTAWSSGRR